MSTETTETKVEDTKVKTVEKGLRVRRFNGKIAEDKDKKTPEIKYQYDRIVLPWSRAGKDVEDKEVEGALPSLSEILSWSQSQGFTTEFKIDAELNPEGPSVVGFLVEGINSYLNKLARTKAENTPDSAKEKAIQVFMSKTGMNRADAIEFLKKSFGG